MWSRFAASSPGPLSSLRKPCSTLLGPRICASCSVRPFVATAGASFRTRPAQPTRSQRSVRERPPHLPFHDIELESAIKPADPLDSDDPGRVKDEDVEEALDSSSSTEDADVNDVQSLAQGTLRPQDIYIPEVKPDREMHIATLRPDLSRVLFSHGVQVVQDHRTGVLNFSAHYTNIPKPSMFAFDRLPQYIKPSQDEELQGMAVSNECAFIGSTSTLTQALSQIYFALSSGRGVDTSHLSREFADSPSGFTPGAELPASLIISQSSNGVYTIDSDKRWDSENVLSDYGRILENQLIRSRKDLARFLKSAPATAVPEEERTAREAYRYRKFGKLLMRSQLDCHDSRLPGNGVFDIKTRACAPIRHDRANFAANSAYDVYLERGWWESYERELYDLSRAGMLKFSMQVRIGDMDGIFLAYHNTSRIYGFQYLPLEEIDRKLFGSTAMAESAFRICVGLWELVVQRIVECFPGQDIDVTVHRKRAAQSVVFLVQPRNWDETQGERPIRALRLRIRNELDGVPVQGPVEWLPGDSDNNSLPPWSVHYTLTSAEGESVETARKELEAAYKLLEGMQNLSVPSDSSPTEMTNRDKQLRETRERSAVQGTSAQDTSAEASDPNTAVAHEGPVQGLVPTKWVWPTKRVMEMRRAALESGEGRKRRMKSWRKKPGFSFPIRPPHHSHT